MTRRTYFRFGLFSCKVSLSVEVTIINAMTTKDERRDEGNHSFEERRSDAQ